MQPDILTVGARGSLGILLERSNLPIQILRPDGRRVFANRACVTLFGYSSYDEFLSSRPLAAVAPEYAGRVRRTLREFFRSELDTCVFENRSLHRDGTSIWLEAHLQRVEWEGEPALLVIFIDITHRRSTEEALRRSETSFRSLIERSNLPTQILRLDGTRLFVNEAAARLFGYDSVDELLAVPPFELVASNHRENARRRYADFLAGGEQGRLYDYEAMRKDGRPLHVQTHQQIVRWDGADAIFMVFLDITERERGERIVRESEERLKNAERIANFGNWEIDLGTHRLTVSDQAMRILGLDGAGAQPDTAEIVDMFHADDLPRVLRTRAEAIRTGAAYSLDYRLVRRDDDIRHIRERGEVVRADDIGRAPRLAGVVQDMTDLYEARSALAERENFYRELIELLPDPVYVHVDQRIVMTNSATVRQFRARRVDDIIGLDPDELLHPDCLPVLRQHRADRFAGAQGLPYSRLRYRRLDGTYYDGEGNSAVITWEGRPARVVVVRDITERIASEQAIKESEEAFRDLIEGAVLGIQIRAFEGGRLYANRAFREMFGFASVEEALAAPEGNVSAPHDRPRVLGYIEARRRGEPAPMEYDLDCIRLDGRILPTRVYMREIAWQGQRALQMTIVDLSDLKHAEQEVQKLNQELEERVERRTEELRQAQSELVKRERLATLGQLTATVSHELRNPLGAMRSSMYVVRKRIGEVDNQLATTLERIDRNITRCDAIIDELLDFTRIRELQYAQVTLDDWVGELLDEQALPGRVVLDRAFGAPGARAWIDPDRMRRAVVNALDNAVQAATHGGPDCPAPRVTVATRARAGRMEIVISDTGPGIAADVLPRIFEPLYSTRSFGIGLGLTVIKQIMEQHRGGIDIETRPGKGTTVTLWAPGHG